MSDFRPRVLVLVGKTSDRQETVRALGDRFQIDLFENVDEAMAALRSGKVYQSIFADVGDFLPLERALVDQQASLVLNTIGEGVCVVNERGECAWANDKMQKFPPGVFDRVKQTCVSARSVFQSQVSPGRRGGNAPVLPLVHLRRLARELV